MGQHEASSGGVRSFCPALASHESANALGPMTARHLGALFLALALSPTSTLAAGTAGQATGRISSDNGEPTPSLLWLSTQLLPSPALALGGGPARMALQWQVTPLLFSWGAHRRVSGLRAFVVEPRLRQGGSVEFFVSPEYLNVVGSGLRVRPGLRAYWPVLEHGETLSISLGLSHQRVVSSNAVAIEAGAHILFGILGMTVSHAPGPTTPAQTLITLKIRYF